MRPKRTANEEDDDLIMVAKNDPYEDIIQIEVTPDKIYEFFSWVSL